MMTQIFGYLSLALFILSFYLIGKRVSRAKKGNAYTKRRTQRNIGILLLFPAALSLVMAYVYNVTTAALPDKDDVDDDVFLRGVFSSPNMPLPSSAATQQAPAKPDPDAPFRRERELNAALAKLNFIIQSKPDDAIAYADRGSVYAAKKSWNQAEDDFRSALKLKPSMAKAAFDLAEMEFEQKKYDRARPGFDELTGDPHLGDLAAYKVFLCDLLAGHNEAADKELEAFNLKASGASYYFANIAWMLNHNKTDEARDWLTSANRIYLPYKTEIYSASLTDLGYLPIPPKEGK